MVALLPKLSASNAALALTPTVTLAPTVGVIVAAKTRLGVSVTKPEAVAFEIAPLISVRSNPVTSSLKVNVAENGAVEAIVDGTPVIATDGLTTP